MRVSGLWTLVPLLLAVLAIALLVPALFEDPAPVDRLADEPAAPPPEPEPASPELLPDPPPRTAALFGVVTGEPLAVAAGAWISLSGLREEVRGSIGEGGVYAIEAVPPDTPFDVWVGPDAHGERVCRLAEGVVLSPGERRRLDLSVRTEAALVGRVVGEGREPVAGARVALLPRGTDWRRQVPVAAVTGKDGAFYIGLAGDPPGDPRLLVVDAVSRGYVLAETIVEPAEMLVGNTVEIALEMGLEIGGVVVGPDGRPIPSARVHLVERLGDEGVERRPAEGIVATDAEGRFSDNAYRPGIYWAFASGDVGGERFALVRNDVRAGDRNVELRFPGFGALHARFVDDESGEPLETRNVGLDYVWDHTGESEAFERWLTRDSVKALDVERLPAGWYRLWAATPGRRSFVSDLFAVERGGEYGPVEFRLRAR